MTRNKVFAQIANYYMETGKIMDLHSFQDFLDDKALRNEIIEGLGMFLRFMYLYRVK